MQTTALAHSANDYGKVEPLREHLQAVADRAAELATAFGASDEAALAGLFHDLGKYGELFQRRLQHLERGVDHWSSGAWAALMRYQNKGLAAALAIAGHHTGLRSGSPGALRELDPKKLLTRHPLGLKLSGPSPDALVQRLVQDGIPLPAPERMPDSLFGGYNSPLVGAMLDVRMLFSTLVDADFLETEAHFQGGPDGKKRFREVPLELRPQWALSVLMEFLRSLSVTSGASSEMKSVRDDLLSSCLAAADQVPGLYTLTAPTGAGKTLAMLAFALRHAAIHGLRRVIAVIPYLTIIEQTVGIYRKVFSSVLDICELERYILEHHSLSGIRFEQGNTQSADQNSADSLIRSVRLLAENWDAPIVVTTSLQLLESLFSNRPSACRKLHRLAGSVLLFDEVQTLRTDLAVPTLAALSRLVERYGATVVFSTATQPAFQHLDAHVRRYCAGGWRPQEIAVDSASLFRRAARTTVHWPSSFDERTSWEDLARTLAEEQQALCIVNLKRHALELYDSLEALGTDSIYHMSTNMCPAHRSDVLESIREMLETGKPCRLISTQCVEAGVDIDFPVVYRAFGPLDAIAQAAGRCNRNGRSDSGDVFVFLPQDESYPDGAYRQAASVARAFLSEAQSRGRDIHSPEMFGYYYRSLYDLSAPQNANEKLQAAIQRLDFEAVAELYRVISQDAVNVLVPYDPLVMADLEREVQETGLTRRWIARARPYCISLFRPRRTDPVWDRLIPLPLGRKGFSEEWFVYAMSDHYHAVKGLVVPDSLDCLIA
jgi:CRISPR-associated helicase Cas3/CRISPR-associated endonuclease Cas3-HD